jgi:hypothetical protein
VTDIGSAVFASADDAITLTPGAQEAMVGRIVGVHATNQAIVRLRPFAEELAGT